MKLQILSDIHAEFHKDKGISWAKSLDPTNVDILVIAGDLGLIKDVEPLFNIICNKYPRVIYVVGNHEYYYSNWGKVEDIIGNLELKYSNLITFSDMGWWRPDGLNQPTFIVGTLWFNDSLGTEEDRWRLNDFSVIEGFRDWYLQKNAKAISFLNKQLAKDNSPTIVITHHLPSEKCSHPKYRGSLLQPFFVNNLDYLIEKYQPTIWLHGHGHYSKDFYIGKTRLVCNPFGYAGREINLDFKEKLVVEI